MPSTSQGRSNSNAVVATSKTRKMQIFGCVVGLLLIIGVSVGIALSTNDSEPDSKSVEGSFLVDRNLL